MRIGDYAVHDLAGLLPLMDGEPFDELVADVREHGLREPIVLLPAIHRDPEMILDGRNRLRACLEADRRPRFVYYRGSTDLASLIEFVRSHNLLRRHLSPTQIANAGLMYDDWYRAAARSRMRDGGAAGGRSSQKGSADLRSPRAGKSSAALAQDLGVSARTVESVRRARRLGTPEVVAAMAGGELSADTASDLVRLAPDAQDHALEEARRTGQSVRSLVRERLAAPAGDTPSDVRSVQAAFDRFAELAAAAAAALASARDAAVSARVADPSIEDSIRAFQTLSEGLLQRHRPERRCDRCAGEGCARCGHTGWLAKVAQEDAGQRLRLVGALGDAE